MRDLGVYAEVRASETPAAELSNVRGIVISGGPSSVYDPGSPTVDPAIFELALERAGVRAVDATYVGDVPAFDVDPPRALGMHAVLLDRRGRYPEHAGPRIGDLRMLPSTLANA